ncbi:hypothetical protein ACFFTN_01455 [Aminobacter aganoensis]|uniref:Uncharacterized protein n=1 Tax=Aminobacter aganoensis TaxID=83264 RepID=A0A7X0KJW4_9HYPH|nr:hypothetical protein [Aminobacter aganoensis]MBB6353474.1 hypothetical protein [Aminobacter aganoensis]
MNYLALCQRVASESGTVSGVKPTTVVGQVDRLAKIVRWVDDAWRQIQNAHSTWLWMQAEFYGPTVASQQRYAYSAFNDLATASTITRFADWIYSSNDVDSGITIYDPSIGVADEGALIFRDWEWFYRTQLRGTQSEGKPSMFAIAPDSKIVLSWTPDKVYTIRGRYRKDTQVLAADADIPELPTRFHDVIVDIALMLLGTHDEAPTQIPLWRMRQSEKFSNLERDQLPRMSLGDTLA